MQLRDFGQRSGKQVTRASMGGMRFPDDHDEAVELIRYAIDNGMRYIDTSRGYGESEIKIGKALKDGYREKVILSTKWSPFIQMVEEDDQPTAACMYKRIRECIDRLDVEYLDYFQLWNIQKAEEFEIMTRPDGMLDGIRQAIDEGLVKRTGFTAHSTVKELESYLPRSDWADIILVSCHMLNRTWEPFLKTAHDNGIGTIVMNPVGGGMLTYNTGKLKELADEVGAVSVPDMAIRWLMANPYIDTIISGIANKKDVDAVTASIDAEPLSEEAVKTINKRIEEFKPENLHFCTACGYCKPCPENINIPAVMGTIYNKRFLGLDEFAKNRYNRITPNASQCRACGACEMRCTQRIPIVREMMYAKDKFTT